MTSAPLRGLALRAASLLAVALGASAVLPATASADEASAAAYDHYVSIGDSFVAGPLVTSERVTTSVPLFGCMRSSSNYPAMLAERLGVTEFTDASCSGAVIEDLYEPQFSDVLPQLDALTPETDLVTVGISGNDFGFSSVFVECAKQSLSNPLGNPCERHYGDELSQRVENLRGEVATVYADIAQRSPNATVLSVGYLQILPESGGCWPSTPVARGDVPFLDRVQTELNTMIAQEAAAQGAVFVDVMERGHDVCKGSGTRWVEGLIPENGAPIHPNRLGMEATADFVAQELGVPVQDAA
ncbi:SGNH/GDSL hydrolase family protein [Nocardiopsis flavescens]|uniref:GDSL-like Lipase/Acylhydrolase family protein n=1 Tax=Nocardiopsis flavescens TaxID=758803 RepID=A0A1M6TL19_9ACTN|nr:SGNH/GDSL hydrolase family protein [Nocardiopsis flavescens]SHK57651.1 GDSL-like Lipase/Acylhydrolase family protein [Nocardiopsis flavescens]